MDTEACYRAIEGRDARFAGRFFLGVRTTRIYCRPGCPARTPRRENVLIFPSAAAAQKAGFRACRRCRPDATPGSPAQAGTGATLSRALRLLEESGDAAGLPDRLGVTDRHLRRLFARHLGATPAEVLRTRRLHLARQLLETSSLRMIDVAHAAGFQSLRRFNEAVRRGFGRTPSQLRSRPADGGAELLLRLPFHPPLDFEALCAFFSARALPGLEEAGDGAWRRRLPEGWLEVRRDGPAHLEARMPAPLAPRALEIAARVQRVFDLRADPRPIIEHLKGDASLRPFLRPGVRIPGAWDPFEMAVRAILGQQISVARARSMAVALIERFGGFPSPAQLAETELTGMPGARAGAIRELARGVVEGRIRLDGSQDLESAASALCALPGIGDWTAQVIALRALGEPDAFPAADLGLLRALALSPRELAERAEKWRPWRGYAAAAVWLS
ncbi:MAG TPA: Ada metal-binding domain-containing protein [Myxococcales bacterium]|nr:Ada metal-binding domain-containing protein [Myxococcales bacterium]